MSGKLFGYARVSVASDADANNLDWLRKNGVEIISLRESIDQDRAMGRAMLHLAIVLAEMERDLARERTLAGLERVKATGKHLGRRKGVSRKRAEEIQNMRQRDGLSWGRIATITGLPSSSIRRICTWDLEEIAPTAFWGRIAGVWRARLSGWKGELFCVPFFCQATPNSMGSAPKERMIGRPR